VELLMLVFTQALDDSGHVQRGGVKRWNALDHRRGQEQRQLGPTKNQPVDALLIA
jgi:hypothetical protein